VVAPLEPEQQVEWLEAAVVNGWSVEELRGQLREPDLPAAVEVVPSTAEEEALLTGYRLLRQSYGDATPARVLRAAERRLQRIDREREAERIKALALGAEQGVRDTLRLGDGVEIRTGDFRAVLADVPDASIDLLFTDPPYHAQFLPLWDDLAVLAARVLKPGHLLVAYSGNLHADRVIAALGDHLEFVTTGAVFMPGRHQLLHGPQVFTTSKPLLFFSAGRYKPRRPFQNGYWVRKPEKTLHPWQQEAGCARYYVETLTQPGELVLDPFLGSGTVGVATVEQGRRFLGSDVDAASVSAAADRIAPALEVGRA
jgi:hypothetical protein